MSFFEQLRKDLVFSIFVFSDMKLSTKTLFDYSFFLVGRMIYVSVDYRIFFVLLNGAFVVLAVSVQPHIRSLS